MPALVRATLSVLAVMSAAGTAVTAAVVGIRRAVLRRRAAATVTLSEAIPVHSAYWRARRLKQGDLLYVAIGDSAAQGIGASRPARGYVGLLARHIRLTTGRSVRVANLSQSGGRLRDAIEKQLPALAKLTPDITTVSIGANDIGSFDADRFEREIRIVLDALPPNAIVADLPSFYFGEFERRVKHANVILRREAGLRGLSVAPLHRVTRWRTAARTVLRDVAADFFHPNDRGYAVWARAFTPLLNRALDGLSRADAAPSE